MNESDPNILNEAATKIAKSIVKLSEAAPTSARMTIDRYLKHVCPPLATAGDSNLPLPVVRHPHNQDRAAAPKPVYGLLCFHIGNAILSYYEAIEAGRLKQAPALCLQAIRNMIRRVEYLAQIAGDGIDRYTLAGDVHGGCWLERRELLREVRHAEKQEAEGAADAGGGGSVGGAEGVHGSPKQGEADGLRADTGAVRGVSSRRNASKPPRSDRSGPVDAA